MGVACRHFGTDGVRDIAGQGLLSPDAVRRWGRAIARFLRDGRLAGPVILGRDTRSSGAWIAEAVARELGAAGVTVMDAGIVPTAIVSLLARDLAGSLGIVISASHNPAEYNGIKLLDGNGRKLVPGRESAIEEIWESLPVAGGMVGSDSRTSLAWEARYIDRLKAHFTGLDLSGKEILLDCAAGAAARIAPDVFASFGARVSRCDPEPDGANINRGCGALHPEFLAAEHARRRPFLSFAFDGDADRVLPLDEAGKIRDGDDILALAAAAFRRIDPSRSVTVVGTVLSNVGLDLFLAPAGARVVRCDVGDRNVTEAVERENALVGAEPSGHVIVPAWGPTGDGIVTALYLLWMMQRSGLGFASATAGFVRAPSVVRNVKVASLPAGQAGRPPLETLPRVVEALSRGKTSLAGAGRVLLRYSGTEPLARVLVEGKDLASCERVAENLAEAIRLEVGA